MVIRFEIWQFFGEGSFDDKAESEVSDNSCELHFIDIPCCSMISGDLDSVDDGMSQSWLILNEFRIMMHGKFMPRNKQDEKCKKQV